MLVAVQAWSFASPAFTLLWPHEGYCYCWCCSSSWILYHGGWAESQPGCILESAHPISLPAAACMLTMSTLKDSLVEVKCETIIHLLIKYSYILVCLGHKMNYLQRRPNIKGSFTVSVHKRFKISEPFKYSDKIFKEFTLMLGWSWSQGSVVSIVTGYGMDDRGVRVWVPVGFRMLSSSQCLDRLGSTQPPIQWVPGAVSPGHVADHSPPTRLQGVVLN
jgi:hypothetical protein